jgi:hypothetical protein
MENSLRIKILFFLVIVTFLQGCQSVARLSDFSPSAKIYDFDKIAASKLDGKRSKTESEFYIKMNLVTDSLISNSIIEALTSEGFDVKEIKLDNRAVLAERRMRANEWNSVAGIYYQKKLDGFEIYIRCKVTQDITGGWPEDRAKKIGTRICLLLNNCVQSYSVLTSIGQ